MPGPRLIYSPSYNLGFPGWQRLHPFDLRKYGRAMAVLLQSGAVTRADVDEPRPVNEADLLRVHTRAYLDRLRDMAYVAAALEVPQAARLPRAIVERFVLRPMRWATGGTILAVERALLHGLAINIGGGFHHASRDRAEGFCIYCDIALAIEAAQRGGLSGTILYVDLDAHQGNGVERVFVDDRSVAVLDAYNSFIYPCDQDAKRAIRWDVPLRPMTGGTEYLEKVRSHLEWALHEVKPVLIIYNAGTDILAGDPLGGLDVPYDAVLERDRLVLDAAVGRSIPCAMVTSGGYTEQSHRLIAETAAYAVRKWGGRPDGAFG